MILKTIHIEITKAVSRSARKLKSYAGFIFILAILSSCQNVEKPKAPENLISESDMIAILTESYLMNAARSTANRTIARKGIKLDSILFTKYNIDSLQFAQSNAYYSTNLNTYKDIFTKVEENLNLEKTKRDTLYARFQRAEAEKKRLDSIARIQDSINGVLDEDVDEFDEDEMETQTEEESQDSIRKLRGVFGRTNAMPKGVTIQDSLL